MLTYLALALLFTCNCQATEVEKQTVDSFNKNHSRIIEKPKYIPNNHKVLESSVPDAFDKEDFIISAIKTAREKKIEEKDINAALERRKEVIEDRKDLEKVGFHIISGGFLFFHNQQ